MLTADVPPTGCTPGLCHASASHGHAPPPRARRDTGRRAPLAFLGVLVLLTPLHGRALDRAQVPPGGLKTLSIEELMNIDITTAARRPEAVGRTDAAVTVITRDDIRRSGVSTIPDALRLATGVAVSMVNNSTWAVSARGFHSTAGTKVLVMIDDVPVNSPLFRGVFWNTVDYTLDDIERIEVIRGPVTLWGANALNGIVNIITRHTADTQGLTATFSSGSEDRAIAELRYGGGRPGITWRAYGKFGDRAAQRFASGVASDDARRRGQGGFRLDAGPREGTRWMVKGDAFHSHESVPDTPERNFTMALLQTQLTQVFAAGSRLAVQSYYRREHREAVGQLTHTIDIVDVDAQHSLAWGGRHNFVWGGGARYHVGRSQGSPAISFQPPNRNYGLATLFARDEISVVPERLVVSLGAQVEHNAFSGFTVQPSARARLMMPHNQVLWGGISQGARRPTRLEVDILVTGPGDTVVFAGNPDFRPEKVRALELGYRVRPLPAMSLEATLFHHDYADLRSQDAPPSGGLPLILANSLEGESYGMELGVIVQPAAWWRTQVGYTRLETRIRRVPGSRDVSGGAGEANDPDHLFTLRTSVDLPYRFDVDATVGAVSALPNPVVPGYGELRARLGWRAAPGVELWGVGENLLHDQHPEFGPDLPRRVEIQRAIRAGVTFRF